MASTAACPSGRLYGMEKIKDISEILNLPPAYIFGAARGGSLLRIELERRGQPVAGFIDNFKTGLCDGLKILHPDEFAKQASPETPVIITTMTRSGASQLFESGFRRLFDGYDLALSCLRAAGEQAIRTLEDKVSDGKINEWLLSSSNDIGALIFQLTSRCNLRCVYCTQGLDGVESSTDAPEELIDSVIDYVASNRIREVSMGVFGETLSFKDWTTVSYRLLEIGGVDLTITTNLAMLLSSVEADTLSRYSCVRVSIDTININDQKALRKSVDVRTIIFNITAIMAKAIADGRRPPKFLWQCVVLDRNVHSLVEYVAAAIATGCEEIQFNDVSYYEGLGGTYRSVFDLDDDEFLKAYQTIRAAVELAADHGVKTDFPASSDQRMADRQSAIQRRRRGEAVPDSIVRLTSQNIQGSRVSFGDAQGLPAGQTRLCLEPWRGAVVMPTGVVHTCCVRGTDMGNAKEPGGLKAVVNGSAFTDLQRQLLTGDVRDDVCAKCLYAPPCSPDELRRALLMRKFLSGALPGDDLVRVDETKAAVPVNSGDPGYS